MKVQAMQHPFEHPESSTRRPMPLVDAAHDRTASDVVRELVDYLRCPLSIQAHAPVFSTYGEFVDRQAPGTQLQVVEVQPFRGLAAWSFQPELLTRTVDLLFGGGGGLGVGGAARRGGLIERRLVGRLAWAFSYHYARAWQEIHRITLVPLRQETDVRLAQLGAAQESVLHGRFTVVLGETPAGEVELCMPWSPLRPAWAAASGQPSSTRAPEAPHWRHKLQREVEAASVEMVATLSSRQITLADVLSFNVGDLIPIEIGDAVELKANGHPLMKGSYGVSHGRYAVKTTESMRPPDDWPRGTPETPAPNDNRQEAP
jgi:flagellar motor switch protein FliM